MGDLFRELKHRKVFRVGGVYAVVAWLLIQVADTIVPIMSLPETVPRLVLVLLVVLFPIALCLAWVFQITPDGIKIQTGERLDAATSLTRKQTLSYSVLGLLGLTAIVFTVNRFAPLESTNEVAVSDTSEPVLSGTELVTAMRSIAVLPFANFSTDEEIGFFAQGLSEEILDQLIVNEWLNIASRTASFQAAERGETMDALAEQLQVAYILEGSVRRLGGDSVRITAQLIRASDGFHLWSKSYEESYSDEFAMQTTVAANIAFVSGEELFFDVWRNTEPIVNDALTGIDPQAIEYYFDGQYEYLKYRTGGDGSLLLSERYASLASEIAPNFYLAHVELAWFYHQRINSSMVRGEASLKAHAAINRALELNPTDPEILFQLIQIYLLLDWNLELAQQTIEQLLSELPACPFCYLFLAGISSAEDRISESRELSDTGANMIQGLEKVAYWREILFLMINRDETEQALELIAQGLALVSDGEDRAVLLQHQAAANIQMGNVNEAKALIEDAWTVDNGIDPEYYIYLYAKTDQEEKARAILEDQDRELNEFGWLALAYLVLGEIDTSFEFIERGIEDRNLFLLQSLQLEEIWGGIHHDPRFDEMLALRNSRIIHTAQYIRNSAETAL